MSDHPAVLTTPEDFQFPLELTGSIPRVIPPDLIDSPAMKRRFWRCLKTTVAGVVMIGLGVLPITKTVAAFVLPLAYLIHLGVIVFAVGLLMCLHHWTSLGVLRYVQEAEVFAGYVEAIEFKPSLVLNSNISSYYADVTVRFLDCVTQQWSSTVIMSPDISVKDLSRTTLSFRKCDWVSLVRLPSDREFTLQIYDFLGLSKGRGLLMAPVDRWNLAFPFKGAGVIGLLLITAIMLWSMTHCPTITSFPLTAFLLSVVLALPITAVWLWWNYRSGQQRSAVLLAANQRIAVRSSVARDRQPDTQSSLPFNDTALLNHTAGAPVGGPLRNPLQFFVELVLAGGSYVLIATLAFGLILGVNAGLDRSPGVRERAKILAKSNRTHLAMIREWRLTFTIPARRDHAYLMLTSPSHLNQFDTPDAVAVVKPGFLGWPWVSDLQPGQQRDH